MSKSTSRPYTASSGLDNMVLATQLVCCVQRDSFDAVDLHTRDLWGDEWVRAWLDGEGDDDPAVADAVDISRRHVRHVLGELDEAGDLDREHTGLGRASVYDPVAQPGAAAADDIDGGFSDDDIEAWMETAVDPIESETEQDDEEP